MRATSTGLSPIDSANEAILSEETSKFLGERLGTTAADAAKNILGINYSSESLSWFQKRMQQAQAQDDFMRKTARQDTSTDARDPLNQSGLWSSVATGIGGVATGINNFTMGPLADFARGDAPWLKSVNSAVGFNLLPDGQTPSELRLMDVLEARRQKDGWLSFTQIPVIPTLAYHQVRWNTDTNSASARQTYVKATYAISSRLTIRLLGRGTSSTGDLAMTLLVNPTSLQIARAQDITMTNTRSTQVVNPHGERPAELHFSGKTAAFFLNNSITHTDYDTMSYSNLVLLLNFFLNNGYFFDAEDASQIQSGDTFLRTDIATQNPTDALTDSNRSLALRSRINSMSYVVLEYQKQIYYGHFTRFEIRDSSHQPYLTEFSFSFQVAKEADIFKIDGLGYDGSPSSNSFGHINNSARADAFLQDNKATAMKDMGDPTKKIVVPKHPEAIISSQSFSPDSGDPKSLLNPTVDVKLSLLKISVKGFNTQLKDDHVYGVGPGGQVFDYTQRANVRSLMVYNPNTSPVRYETTCYQATPTQVWGTLSVSPGKTGYKVKFDGTMKNGKV